MTVTLADLISSFLTIFKMVTLIFVLVLSLNYSQVVYNGTRSSAENIPLATSLSSLARTTHCEIRILP